MIADDKVIKISQNNKITKRPQMITPSRIVAMLKKFRSLTGAPMMSTLGEESEEPSSPTKVNFSSLF